MKDIQGKAVGAFWVELKKVENEFGNTVLMTMIVRDPNAELVHPRFGSGLAFSIAAEVERNTAPAEEWVVSVERRTGRWYVKIQLSDGSPAEAKRAKELLQKVLRAA